MTLFCDMIYFITVFLFGVAVSACFAGIPVNRKNLLSLLIFCTLDGILQLIIFCNFDTAFSKQLYPVMTHLPLILFLILVHKCAWTNAVVSVLTGYLCCQIPRWCGLFFNFFFNNCIAYTIIYILSAILTFYILHRYVARLTQLFLKQAKRNAFMLGIVPLCYYLFDYMTTIYTDWLYSGNETAVQFMPSVSCFFYFVFIIYYYRELELQEQAKHEADSLNLQLEHAAITLNNMRTMQTQTIAYRHDMRHHCTYLQRLAEEGNLKKLTDYLNTIQSDIEAITPKRFCQNELINLVLSTYDTKASEKNITLNIYASVPKELPVSDTKLCAILSNALENALHATERTTEKSIQVQLKVRNMSLLIQISNPFTGSVKYDKNIPSTTREQHGFGTKSIAMIVESYHGQYEFIAENQMFTVRVMLPLHNETC